MKRELYCVSLSILIAVLAIAGCNSQQSVSERYAPKPESVLAKTDREINCTFLKWDAGLRLMVADRCGDGGWRGTLMAEDPDQPFVWCGSLNNPQIPEHVLKWTIRTFDGADGIFDINGETYDLSKGKVFLLEPTSTGFSANQFDFDINELDPTEDAVSAFASSHFEGGTQESEAILSR
ncbi:MAG: hypothetical protein Q8M16_03165 [Pirellulaceae bacterium]|nr:hypothetical protein [Pirellulaceae bacterium]